ncbi:MAG: panthothenate synthetase [Gammaproteobacteria bacterium]|jgi:hypothetical protein
MRILQLVRFPHETFNAAVRDGSAESKTRAILEVVKPEAVYFTEMDGRRTAVLIVELESSSMVPALAEPWFLTFNADVEFHVVMDTEELQESGLVTLGQKWA